eukprot:14588-Heterococcus_DN1.PRE.4
MNYCCYAAATAIGTIQFLGIEVSEEKQEKLFKQYDTDGSGTIDYEEFKKIWVRHANVRKTSCYHVYNHYSISIHTPINANTSSKLLLVLAALTTTHQELTDRNVKVHKFATAKQLERRLAAILDEEDDREVRALAEADRWARWQALLRGKRTAHARAKRRAEAELKSALDAAGSVYVFGAGGFSEFAAEPPPDFKQGRFRVEHWDLLKEMWSRRVTPVLEVGVTLEDVTAVDKPALASPRQGQQPDADSVITDSVVSSGASVSGSGSGSNDVTETGAQAVQSEYYYDPERDPTTSPFRNLAAAAYTAAVTTAAGRSSVALWGKRVSQVALSDGTAFALSELGEVFAWGGRSHWWHNLVPDSHWQQHWRGDTTERSKLLLQTVTKPEPTDEDEQQPLQQQQQLQDQQLQQQQLQQQQQQSDQTPEQSEDALIDKYKLITEYFGVWKPPPTNEHLEYIREELLPAISFDAVKLSLACRGKHPEDCNKLQLIDMLHEALMLEKRILGVRLHKRIRQLELEVVSNTRRGRSTMAKSLRLEIEAMWLPLMEIQAEDAAQLKAVLEVKKELDYFKSEQVSSTYTTAMMLVYRAWRDSIAVARSYVSIPRATGQPLPELALLGLTERAGESTAPYGVGVAVSICAGANHALLLHRTGQLYTWVSSNDMPESTIVLAVRAAVVHASTRHCRLPQRYVVDRCDASACNYTLCVAVASARCIVHANALLYCTATALTTALITHTYLPYTNTIRTHANVK